MSIKKGKIGKKSHGRCVVCQRDTTWIWKNGCWVCQGDSKNPHNPQVRVGNKTNETKEPKTRVKFCPKCQKRTEQTHRLGGTCGMGYYCKCGRYTGH